jgi:hypothetical protein
MDIYRQVQRQATLFTQQEHAVQAIRQCPHLKLIQPTSLESFLSRFTVTDYDCARTREGVVRIEVSVQLVAARKNMDTILSKKRKHKVIKTKNGPQQQLPSVAHDLNLTFAYERDPLEQPGTVVNYSIELSSNHGKREKLLWIQVVADGCEPSRQSAAINMDETELPVDDDSWEDMESDNGSACSNQQEQPETQPSERDANNVSTDVEQSDEDNVDDLPTLPPRPDRFVAGIEPECLSVFLNVADLGPIDELTAFFLLMAFPFYEHEWDLVGFMLDSIFGAESDDDNNNEIET